MLTFLDFEKPVAELEAKIRELRDLGGADATVDISEEVGRLETKLDPWQKTQVARHPERPHFTDIAAQLIEDFTPLAGDRAFADDDAIIGGLGRFRGQSVVVMGHEKGADTQSRIRHNFGMAIRLMDMANRFSLPVITFVDTSGAYPGIGAEERGQSQAIARSTQTCLGLTVPVVACIVGEGGSGGAVALAAGNKVLMMEHAVYSVISPEGCASILWRTSDKAEDAATALKITAQDLKRLNVIDAIVPEPVGGAHREPKRAVDTLGDAVAEALSDMLDVAPDKLRHLRREKFLAMGRNGLA